MNDPSLRDSDFPSQCTVIYHLNKNNNARRQNKVTEQSNRVILSVD